MRKAYRLMAKAGDDWRQVGHVYRRGDGSLTIRVDQLPIGEFDGWLSMWPLDRNPDTID